MLREFGTLWPSRYAIARGCRGHRPRATAAACHRVRFRHRGAGPAWSWR